MKCFVAVTILVDPWLVGELVFYGQEWAFRGKKGSLPPVDVDALAAKTDLIILTQVRSPQLLQNPSQSTSLYCHDSNLGSSQC